MVMKISPFNLSMRLITQALTLLNSKPLKQKTLVTEEAVQAEYQVTNTQKQESQLAMLSRLELSYDVHHQLVKHCESLGIEFLSNRI